VVAAPGKIARAPQDRVKTDRRDAERLVRLLMAGERTRSAFPASRRRHCATWCGRGRMYAAI